MKLALIGATGRVGSRVLAEAQSRGHTITAITRHPENVPRMDRVIPVAGDVAAPDALAETLKGHDAIVSAVRFRDFDLESMLRAVKGSGVKRYIMVGGAGSREVRPGVALIDTPEFAETARPEAGAGREALKRLKQEDGLAWSFLSPSATIEPGERTGKFRLGGDALLVGADGKSRISFEDYAVALVDELETPKHIHRRFTVGY
jgi:putative NADH-flavin reductase